MTSGPYGLGGAQPHPAPYRAKYRVDAPAQLKPGQTEYFESDGVNIHQDARVVRGNTYAKRPQPANVFSSLTAPPTPTDELNKKKRAAKAASMTSQRAALATQLYCSSYSKPRRQKEQIDLSKYLIAPESGSAKAAMGDCTTQTDTFTARPESPYYRPVLAGTDVDTQIEEGDGLFNFDTEIGSLLDVLVGKTLEQSKLEVEREHELQEIERSTTQLQTAKAEAAAAVAELEKAAVRAHWGEESIRRLRYEEAQARFAAKKKVACVSMAQQCWPDLFEGACAALSSSGAWQPRGKVQLSKEFVPWLVDSACDKLQTRIAVYSIVNSMCADVDSAAAAAMTAYEAETARVKAVAAAAEAARVEAAAAAAAAVAAALAAKKSATIRIWLEGAAVGLDDGRIGPITVTAGQTVASAETAVQEWLIDSGLTSATQPEGGYLSLWLDLTDIDKDVMTLIQVQDKAAAAAAAAAATIDEDTDITTTVQADITLGTSSSKPVTEEEA
jgi:Radial spoke protein 3